MISVQNLSKKHGQLPIFHNISFEVIKGTTIGLIGHSGSGKSTLLRCLHGIESFEGHIMNKMKTGLIFQNFNLFPHMNVLENITYAPIKVMNEKANVAAKKAKELLKRMHLADKENYYPQHLSGGQKQRVAIIRALMMSPELLLIDEPTSALDPSLTKEVIEIIEDLKENQLTLIIASHDLHFLKQSADRILLLDKGQIIVDQSKIAFFQDKNDERKNRFLHFLDNLHIDPIKEHKE
jgi:ABC-type polar amino acid transport system ATPase subunit